MDHSDLDDGNELDLPPQPKLRRQIAQVKEGEMNRYRLKDGSIFTGNLDLTHSSNADIKEKILPWIYATRFYGSRTCKDQALSNFYKNNDNNPDNEGSSLPIAVTA